jgi:AcrR family transcriptional regulator
MFLRPRMPARAMLLPGKQQRDQQHNGQHRDANGDLHPAGHPRTVAVHTNHFAIHYVAVNAICNLGVELYASGVPKLWTDTIDAHRRHVRDTILSTTAALVEQRGRSGVTMSQIAERTGIGRATLYKYFGDVEAILHAWHERQINAHLEQLSAVAGRHTDPAERLRAVLEAFAGIAHSMRAHRDTELAALLHAGQEVGTAQQHLHGMITGLVREGVAAGAIRDDVPPDELARFCLHALTAAGDLASRAAVRRLVAVTMTGLQRVGAGGPVPKSDRALRRPGG